MLQKFKITFYTLIVLFVLSGFSSQDVGIDKFIAESCAGWNCTYEGQLCPEGAEGARGTSFICLNSKWVPTNCEMRDDYADYQGGLFGFAFFHKKSIAQSVDEIGGALCVGGGVIKRKSQR